MSVWYIIIKRQLRLFPGNTTISVLSDADKTVLKKQYASPEFRNLERTVEKNLTNRKNHPKPRKKVAAHASCASFWRNNSDSEKLKQCGSNHRPIGSIGVALICSLNLSATSPMMTSDAETDVKLNIICFLFCIDHRCVFYDLLFLQRKSRGCAFSDASWCQTQILMDAEFDCVRTVFKN